MLLKELRRLLARGHRVIRCECGRCIGDGADHCEVCDGAALRGLDYDGCGHPVVAAPGCAAEFDDTLSTQQKAAFAQQARRRGEARIR